jgi:hypothetical protein
MKPVHHAKVVTAETPYLQTQPLWRVDAAQQKFEPTARGPIQSNMKPLPANHLMLLP